LRALRKEPKPCWLCGGDFDKWLALHKEISRRLLEARADSFLVGVKLSKSLARREDELWRRFGVTTAESLKSELKRELGKLVSKRTGIPVNFEEPGVLVVVSVPKGAVEVKVNPIKVYGRYVKLGRNISQSLWLSRSGEKVYKLSVQEALSPLKDYYSASSVVLHAAGREDVDVRMLGTGRPMVVEVKDPAHRDAPLEFLERLVNSSSAWARFSLERRARRSDVRAVKVGDALEDKLYRALVFSERPVDEELLAKIEGAFTNVVVHQRTPSRVLRRRADVVRKKAVYFVATRKVSRHLFESLIKCEGGLYVKELISGDGGRTQPSFSDVAGAEMKCVELDVLKIEERWASSLASSKSSALRGAQ